MNNATILYYTSNKEDPNFENRVIENLLKVKGDLPIISISHKPLYSEDYLGLSPCSISFAKGFRWQHGDFGLNICVGDVGASGFNMFRQVQIGLKEVKTEFVISAEADCLYPPDYFTYRPPRNDKCYRNSNLYVMPDYRDYFFYKEEGATHSQIVGTKYYLDRLNHLFKDAPEWSVEEINFPKERHKMSDIFSSIKHYKTENPVFQIKTHKGMRYYTRSDRTPIPEIPYWGNGKAIRIWYIKGIKI